MQNTIRNSLSKGQYLYPSDHKDCGENGDFIWSKNGISTLTYQNDGNLVLYRNGKAVWATGTEEKNAGKAIMQSDGNFVIYTSSDKPIWSSNTYCDNNENAEIILQDDRNLVIYTTGGKAVWSSGTNYWYILNPN